MRSRFLSLRLLGLIAAAASIGSLHAQSFSFDSVTETPTNFAGGANQYRIILSGNSEDDFTYPAFNVHVGAGAGTAVPLVDQSYLALCVNISFPSPDPNVDYTLSNDGSSLSYNYGGGDVWAVNQTVKYNAIKDIVAAYGGLLVGLDQNSAEFQQRVVALTALFADIAIDFDGTTASLDLNSGLFQFRAAGTGDPLTGAVAGYYNDAKAQIGNGLGAGYTLYGGGIDGAAFQDVILIPVPEPSAALLMGAAGFLGLARRRRVA